MPAPVLLPARFSQQFPNGGARSGEQQRQAGDGVTHGVKDKIRSISGERRVKKSNPTLVAI